MSFTDLSLEVAAEFGAYSGAREYFCSDGYSFRKLAKLKDPDLQKLAASVHFKRWFRKVYAEGGQRLEAMRLRKRLEARKPSARAKQAARSAKYRRKLATANPRRAHCESCHKSWVVAYGRRGPLPRFCSPRCICRARRLLQGAKPRPDLTPAQRLEAKRTYQREWQRRRAALRRAA